MSMAPGLSDIAADRAVVRPSLTAFPAAGTLSDRSRFGMTAVQ
jgi:hypothetical protein